MDDRYDNGSRGDEGRGLSGTSSVPGGTSTGKHEALELRDSENPRYQGKGVWKAVNNVNTILGPAIVGTDPMQQAQIDKKLIDLDEAEKEKKELEVKVTEMGKSNLVDPRT